MQTRRFVTAMLLSMGIFMLWMSVAHRLFPPPATQPVDTAATGPATQPVPTTAPEGPEAVTTAAASAPSPGGEVVVRGAVTEQTCEIGGTAADNPYPMRIELTNRGAAVKAIQLRDFRNEIGKPDPYPLLDPVEDKAGKRTFYSLATEKIRIETFREDVALNDCLWTFDRAASDGGRAVYRARIARSGQDVLDVVKTFDLTKGPAPGNRRYDVSVSYAVRNLTAEPLDVQLVQTGPMGIHNEDLRSDWRKVLAATREGAAVTIGSHGSRTRATLLKSGPADLGRDEESKTLAWFALTNKYFACIVRPGRESKTPMRIVKAEATISTRGEDSKYGEDLTFRIVTAPVNVAPGGSADLRFACYLGPKSKVAFEKVPEYAAHNYFQAIQADFYCCAPAPIVRLMMWLLQILYVPVHNYGVAIILLVVIVRLILHPVTKAGQVNMMKMQKKMGKIQPKLEELKKKYANDKQKFNEAMMEVYREAGVNPATQMLTCLPMMLQMPIWAGLWAALSSTIEMRHAPFDGFWIKDLTGPDALIPFGREIPIPIISDYLTGPIHGFNLLPILLSITMYLQQKLMPKTTPPPGTSQAADQMAQQQKMMNFMTVLFGFMLYNAPSGLNLYIMASNLGGILEQKRIRKHVEELEKRDAVKPPEETGSRKPRWLDWLERQAEQARKEAKSKGQKK